MSPSQSLPSCVSAVLAMTSSVQSMVMGDRADLDRLARLGVLAIAPALGRQIDDHRARLHAGQLGLADHLRRGLAGDRGGGDHEVGGLDMLGQGGVDLGLFLGRQGPGVAALAGGVDAGVDEGRAQGQRLFLGGGADVIGLDHRAQALGGGDRLQPGDAQAHHQHLGRPDDASGRGDLRQHAQHVRRAQRDRVIAGQRRLAGERVHRLGPRDPGDPLHGETGDVAFQQRLDQRRLLVLIDEADQDRPWLHRLDRLRRRRLDGQHHVGVGEQGPAVIHEGDIGEGAVGQLDRRPGAGLHVQPRAQLDQLGGHRRDQGHPPLQGLGLLQNGDVHIHGHDTLNSDGRFGIFIHPQMTQITQILWIETKIKLNARGANLSI